MIFPRIILALQIGAMVESFYRRDYRMGLYWIGANLILISLEFMKSR
jgi:hypothetical protein